MLSASWTVKRMEEGTRFIWKRVCVEEMLTVNILKTQVSLLFPNHILYRWVYSQRLLQIFFIVLLLLITHINLLFNLVTYKRELFLHFQSFYQSLVLLIIFSLFILIIFHLFPLILLFYF